MPRRPLTPDEQAVRRLQRQASHEAGTYKAFLRDLCSVGGMSEEVAEQSAVAVLKALELRLSGDEGQHLEAQLPLALKKLLYGVDRHAGQPAGKFGLDEFLSRVGAELGLASDEAEGVARSVLKVICDHVTEGEVGALLHQLPESLRQLWPAEALARFHAEQAEEAARSKAHTPRMEGPLPRQAPRDGVRRLLAAAQTLPFEAQLGLLRQLSLQVLRRLSPDARLSYWRDLEEDVANADVAQGREGEALH